MGEYIIKGGRVLSGEVKISGAKNAALPIIAASLMTEGAIIYNCPDLLDTRVCIDILKSLGCACSFRSNVLIVEPYGLNKCEITEELCSKMRSSVTFLGALMGKTGEASVYLPGGCVLGKRPVDIHLDAIRLMGGEITEEDNKIICRGKMQGAQISMRYPSVGATENIILAAVLAKGTTTIKNCAMEPEICALADFLVRAGAKINGAGSDTIVIEGVEKLHRCEYTVIGDRIEAGTFMCAAAATGGELFIKGVQAEHLKAVTRVIRELGCVVKESRGLVYIDAPERVSPIKWLETGPYPGFPTDMQAQLTAVLSKADGVSSLEENVFEARNRHIAELNKMGADIDCIEGKHFKINGAVRLKGCGLYSGDLRGGAALVIAALGAVGESRVHNIDYIQRGYENFHCKLADVGADIECIE